MPVETFTFLFTDIEGSTALLRRLGEGLYGQVLADHHALIRSGLAAHDGTEVDTQGDAFFAVFSSPRACVAAVLEMQQALQEHAWPGREQVRVRMGIHTGEASTTAAGLVGLDVHRAARAAAVGYGGQVLLSEAAAVLVRDVLPPGASLQDLGVHRLKDLGHPERIFQLQAAGLQAQFPPLRSLGNPALANNLPAQLASFIGRDKELAEVRALAGSSRLVTLTGAGGCGKTRDHPGQPPNGGRRTMGLQYLDCVRGEPRADPAEDLAVSGMSAGLATVMQPSSAGSHSQRVTGMAASPRPSAITSARHARSRPCPPPSPAHRRAATRRRTGTPGQPPAMSSTPRRRRNIASRRFLIWAVGCPGGRSRTSSKPSSTRPPPPKRQPAARGRARRTPPPTRPTRGPARPVAAARAAPAAPAWRRRTPPAQRVRVLRRPRIAQAAGPARA